MLFIRQNVFGELDAPDPGQNNAMDISLFRIWLLVADAGSQWNSLAGIWIEGQHTTKLTPHKSASVAGLEPKRSRRFDTQVDQSENSDLMMLVTRPLDVY